MCISARKPNIWLPFGLTALKLLFSFGRLECKTEFGRIIGKNWETWQTNSRLKQTDVQLSPMTRTYMVTDGCMRAYHCTSVTSCHRQNVGSVPVSHVHGIFFSEWRWMLKYQVKRTHNEKRMRLKTSEGKMMRCTNDNASVAAVSWTTIQADLHQKAHYSCMRPTSVARRTM